MWIVSNKGFASIVKNRNKKDEFIVRARNIEILEDFFDSERIVETPDADYLFRVFANKKEMKAFVDNVAAQIDYDNFKNSIHPSNHFLKRMANEIWYAAYNFQLDLIGDVDE